jgi:hypothetical protein
MSLLFEHFRIEFNERHGLSVDGLSAVASPAGNPRAQRRASGT